MVDGTSDTVHLHLVSLNNVIQALSINNTGLITMPQGISGYSTTSQVNT